MGQYNEILVYNIIYEAQMSLPILDEWPWPSLSSYMCLVMRKPVFGVPDRSCSNKPAQLQRLARKLIFRL